MPRRAAKGDDSSSSSYLRSKTRVPVRKNVFRGVGPWLARGLAAFLIGAAGVAVAYSFDTYLRKADQFVFGEPDEFLTLTGLRLFESKVVADVLLSDVGNSIYEMPLEQRRRQVEEIAWVESAGIRRVWPNRVWIHVQERRPVAFVRISSSKGVSPSPPKLVDREGVLLAPPPGQSFDLPVVTGFDASMPLSDRRKRMELYQNLMSEFDRSKPYYSSRISEVDVHDPRNAKVTTIFDGELVQLQLGDKNFRHRFEVFLKYFPSWKKELGSVRSVDLRYKGVVATE